MSTVKEQLGSSNQENSSDGVSMFGPNGIFSASAMSTASGGFHENSPSILSHGLSVAGDAAEEKSDCQSPRKNTGKKIKIHVDKDGFVTPNTPEYLRHREELVNPETASCPGIQAETGTRGHQPREHGDGLPQYHRTHKEGELQDQESTSVGHMLREFAEEAKQVYVAWVENFSQGEAYERFSPARIDQILEQAHALEAELLIHKDQLRQRLRLLSTTLQSI